MTEPTDKELEALIDANLLVVEGGQCAFESWVDIRPELVKFARAVLTKWGTPAPVGVEPVGEVGSMPGTDGFTMACFKASDVPIGTKLYTTQQSTQTQAGAVPLTEQAIEAMWSDHWDGFVTFAEAEVVVRATEEAHGIKGGQHV